MFLLYSILYAFVLLFFLPREVLKRPPGTRLSWFREKTGALKKEKVKKGAVWLHAVSVGEVIAAIPFINALKVKGVNVMVSTITDTGQKIARERLSPDSVFYLPFDIQYFYKRIIRRMNPSAFILMETEIWPNAVKSMAKSKVPVFLINARISDKSFKNYFKIRFFMKKIFDDVNTFCVQDETYAQRAIALGARKEKVKACGNFKFELKPPGSPPPAWLKSFGSPLIVAGSTHHGEEEIIARVLKKLKQDLPVKAVLVPRHPERKAEVEQVLQKEGLSSIKSSEISSGEMEIDKDVIIVDTIGQLFNIYSAADLAIVGGSFIAHGGQNPLEPAYWGKAIISGPHMGNFPFYGELVQAGGALALQPDTEALYNELKTLLLDENRRLEMGKKSREFYLSRSGAVQKTVDIFLQEAFPSGTV